MTTVLRYVDDGRHPWIPNGAYLAGYDPDAQDGTGSTMWSLNPDKAMKFEDAGAAMTTWRMTSKVHPVRADGKPNRPLTAFSLMSEEI